MTATPRQIAAIHTIAKRAGLDEEARRAVIQRETGKRSSRDLSEPEAGRVIDALKVFQGGVEPPSKAASGAPRARGARKLSGPYAGVAQALWISAWNLGITHDRTDVALLAFVKRQTGIETLAWVRDAKDGGRVVEALKAWIVREAGVSWPVSGEAVARKRAVVSAQLRILGPAGAPYDFLPRPQAELDRRPDDTLDALAQELGRRIRKLKVAT